MTPVALWLALIAAPALAHDNAPGVLALAELGAGRYRVAYTPPTDTREPTSDAVTPRYPAHCDLDETLLDCGAEGLSGPITLEGLEGTRMRVVVVVRRGDEVIAEHFVTGEAATITLTSPPSGLGAWVALGVEHVLLGLDHLAFVLGLMLVVGLDRRIVLTITAFTLAHSLTLALAALEVVRLPSAPVEACIALSIVLVAREALREGEPTLTRRAPWAVAAIFGLVHGLGFAGALAEIGLPHGSMFSALLGFNLGVELGQLAVVGAAVGVALLVRSTPLLQARPALIYTLGGLGSFWLVGRVAAMIG